MLLFSNSGINVFLFFLVATNQISIVYTKSIDPYNIQLLCTTAESSISLYNIRWNVTTSNNNNENPIILNNLENNEYTLNCSGGTTSSSFNVNLLIQGKSIAYQYKYNIINARLYD